MGDKTYFTGKPCPYGHIAPRYTKSQTCSKCHKTQSKGVKAHIHPFCKIYKAAKSCETRKQFRVEHEHLYLAASKRKILPLLCGHMPKPKTRGVWRFCNLVKSCKDFSSSSDFAKAHPGGYDYAQKIGALSIVTAHMERRLSEYDAVYIWGSEKDGSFICKHGVTSRRLGWERLDSVSKKSGLPKDFEILAKSKFALQAEKRLAQIGRKISLSGFNGRTEFRALTRAQLTQAYEVIYEYADCTTDA